MFETGWKVHVGAFLRSTCKCDFLQSYRRASTCVRAYVFRVLINYSPQVFFLLPPPPPPFPLRHLNTVPTTATTTVVRHCYKSPNLTKTFSGTMHDRPSVGRSVRPLVRQIDAFPIL